MTIVHNPDFADGLSTSLKSGLGALPDENDGALVLLADMPRVDAGLIDSLIDAFDPARGALVVVPTFDGKRGNPVLWSRRFFADLMALQGDVGARHLIGSHAEAVTEVPAQWQRGAHRCRHARRARDGEGGDRGALKIGVRRGIDQRSRR